MYKGEYFLLQHVTYVSNKYLYMFIHNSIFARKANYLYSYVYILSEMCILSYIPHDRRCTIQPFTERMENNWEKIKYNRLLFICQEASIFSPSFCLSISIIYTYNASQFTVSSFYLNETRCIYRT